MKTIHATKIFRFEAAHRLLNYIGPCSNIHGHSYEVHITIAKAHDETDSGLDNKGMVIDFAEIKRKAGQFIRDNFDHAILLHEKDPFVDALIYFEERKKENLKKFLFKGNPTAENIALFLQDKIDVEFFETYYHVVEIKVYETVSSYAEVHE